MSCAPFRCAWTWGLRRCTLRQPLSAWTRPTTCVRHNGPCLGRPDTVTPEMRIERHILEIFKTLKFKKETQWKTWSVYCKRSHSKMTSQSLREGLRILWWQYSCFWYVKARQWRVGLKWSKMRTTQRIKSVCDSLWQYGWTALIQRNNC